MKKLNQNCTNQTIDNSHTKAIEKITELFKSVIFNFQWIEQFRRINKLAKNDVEKVIKKENLEFAKLIFTSDDYSKFFSFPQPVIVAKIGGIANFSQITSSKSLNDFQSFIDASTLVFGHTVLDQTVDELLRATALSFQDEWQKKCLNKTIKIADLLSSNNADCVKKVIESSIFSHTRESIEKKIHALLDFFELNIPQKADYKFSLDRIKHIDKIRQEIIHQIKISDLPTNVDNEIIYLRDTALYFIFSFIFKTNAKIDPQILHSLLSK